MSKISILHISDLHFGKSKTKSIDDFYSTITRDLAEKGIKVDLVICTGDIVDGKTQGKDVAVERAITFFKNLMRRINVEKLYNTQELTVEDFLFVPGNHDIMRSEDVKVRHEKYNQFLDKFYGTKKGSLYDERNCFVTKIYPDEKIAFVGLNSCVGESTLTCQDEEWIEELDYKSLNLEKDKEIELKELLRKSKTTYDDYGEIETTQILEAFDKLKSQAEDIDSYKIVAFFHHHIYPFPEIYDKYGDSSMIRNFSTIIQTLIDKNVKFVFHGHKHIPISRLVTTNKYFDNTQKCLWVFSTGTLENEGGQRAFEVAEIYSPNEMLEAEISKFHYSAEELQKVDRISVPPIHKSKNHSGTLIDILQRKDNSLFEKYRTDIKGYDNTSYRYHIDEIIKNIEKILLNFEGINQDLDKDSKLIFMILCCIHLRILYWDTTHKQSNNGSIIRQIRDTLETEFSFDNEYFLSIQKVLSTIKNTDFHQYFKEIYEKETFNQHKKATSYIAITSFFTDLYLVISDFGEQYFTGEGIYHKINIKLEDNIFDKKISNESISIVGEEDRRSATISFECKDPTVHKASVLIVKDFEERINKIEDAFKYLNLKLYYVRPKVRKSGYEMDNYNFEAYIPTLLPLLTGDNLYAQKEVFVRELIQNSFDAIQLREKLDDTPFNKTIKIKIGRDTEKKKRFLKITDEGVGMDIYKIERYFTSIGRSFYRSRDFEELQKEKKITYKALSNFGIGFLSVFMVCEEVIVKTKSIGAECGINIHIPNYEGCFFINKDESVDKIGTEITIYEDKRGLLNTKNIRKFIDENFLDFKYEIQLDYPSNSITFSSHVSRHAWEKSGFIFIPFEKDTVSQLKKSEIGKESIFEQYNHGYMLGIENFNKEDNKCIYLNEGIKVNICKIPEFQNLPFGSILNFPSSLIELNVSRDQIIGFKNDKNIESFCKDLRKAISDQILPLIDYIRQYRQDKTLLDINNLLWISDNHNKNNSPLYSMYIEKVKDKFILCLSNQKKEKINNYVEMHSDNTNIFMNRTILSEFHKKFFPNSHEYITKKLKIDIERIIPIGSSIYNLYLTGYDSHIDLVDLFKLTCTRYDNIENIRRTFEDSSDNIKGFYIDGSYLHLQHENMPLILALCEFCNFLLKRVQLNQLDKNNSFVLEL